MSLTSVKVATEPIAGQNPGTSGLRKKVKVFREKNYTENFVQSILNALGPDKLKGSVLVVGGDGRFYCKEATNLIISMCGANGVAKVIVGQNGILSTPAVSNLIRKRKATGGIILTASHNPGGPDEDFGIKFNTSNGGPAPDNVTKDMYNISMTLKEYRLIPDKNFGFDVIGTSTYSVDRGSFTVEVVDSVEDYLCLMKDIFDFGELRDFLGKKQGHEPFRILINCLNGVTGPYARRIFFDEFGVDLSRVVNSIPLEDFGGLHPDPNLTYAAQLVTEMKSGLYDFGAAFDGDGDRNMILGKSAFFVTPSDSLAVLAAHLDHIPYFRVTGVKGYARSMPTGGAIDKVSTKTGINLYEVPTGWKYFGNLMDAGKLSICGEESFGTGSDHIREKDGIWAALAWLQILAREKKSVEELVKGHWRDYGRNFFTRYDYENCDVKACSEMMSYLEEKIANPKLRGTKYEHDKKTYVLRMADNFHYSDPVDGSIAERQGIRFIFEDDSRIIYRLSGTGSSGATVRMYVESYVNDKSVIFDPPEEVLQPLISIALEISQLQKFTRRTSPTVIT